jgi:hypothetical protein
MGRRAALQDLNSLSHYWGLIATSPGVQPVQLKRGALGWKLTV